MCASAESGCRSASTVKNVDFSGHQIGKSYHPCFSINVHVVKYMHIYKIQTIWLNRAESLVHLI